MILKAIYSRLSRFRAIFLRLPSHRLRPPPPRSTIPLTLRARNFVACIIICPVVIVVHTEWNDAAWNASDCSIAKITDKMATPSVSRLERFDNRQTSSETINTRSDRHNVSAINNTVISPKFAILIVFDGRIMQHLARFYCCSVSKFVRHCSSFSSTINLTER